MEEIIIKNLVLDEAYYGKVYTYLTADHFLNLMNGEIFFRPGQQQLSFKSNIVLVRED